MSNSLCPHGLQHTRLPCPSPSPRVCSNSCPLSQWYHPTISSPVTPFSSCPQSFPASGSFPVSQLFTSGCQNIGASASASVLPMNIQGRFPLGFTGLISLQTKGLSRVFPSTTVQKHQFFGSQLSLWSNSHIHIWLLKKTIALTTWTFVGKVMSLLCNMLSRLVITFLSRSKRLLIRLEKRVVYALVCLMLSWTHISYISCIGRWILYHLGSPDKRVEKNQNLYCSLAIGLI